MMGSPLAQIREGIQQANWSMVADGFAGLTGERIPIQAEDEHTKAVAVKFKAFIGEIQGVCERAIDGMGDVHYAEPYDKCSIKPVLDAAIVKSPPVHGRGHVSEDKFHVNHGQHKAEVREDGKSPGLTLPYEPPTHNSFEAEKGDLDPVDKADAEKRYLPRRPAKRRPAPQMVNQTCKCGTTVLVNAATITRRAAKDDTESAFVCDSCIGRVVK